MFGRDSATTRTSARSSLDLSRKLQHTRTQRVINPSRGGSPGFPIYQRMYALHTLNQTNSEEAAANVVQCSARTIRRWVQRLIPFRKTGGIPRAQLTGGDQLLLGICIFIYPNATSDEICAFIVANRGGIYSRQAVTKRCKNLGLNQKRSSKEAYAAFLTSSIDKYI